MMKRTLLPLKVNDYIRLEDNLYYDLIALLDGKTFHSRCGVEGFTIKIIDTQILEAVLKLKSKNDGRKNLPKSICLK